MCTELAAGALLVLATGSSGVGEDGTEVEEEEGIASTVTAGAMSVSGTVTWSNVTEVIVVASTEVIVVASAAGLVVEVVSGSNCGSELSTGLAFSGCVAESGITSGAAVEETGGIGVSIVISCGNVVESGSRTAIPGALASFGDSTASTTGSGGVAGGMTWSLGAFSSPEVVSVMLTEHLNRSVRRVSVRAKASRDNGGVRTGQFSTCTAVLYSQPWTTRDVYCFATPIHCRALSLSLSIISQSTKHVEQPRDCS